MGLRMIRAIRTGFTDIMVVSVEFTERRFLMDETLYKGQQAWVYLMALSAVRGEANLVFNTFVKCHQRRGLRGEAARGERGCPRGPEVQRWMN